MTIDLLQAAVFLPGSTVRSEDVRWVLGAAAAALVACGTVPTIVPETRQDSVSRAYVNGETTSRSCRIFEVKLSHADGHRDEQHAGCVRDLETQVVGSGRHELEVVRFAIAHLNL
jgi:hypothetical protein